MFFKEDNTLDKIETFQKNKEMQNPKEHNLKSYEKFINNSNKDKEKNDQLKKVEKKHIERKDRLNKIEEVKQELLKKQKRENTQKEKISDEELIRKINLKKEEKIIKITKEYIEIEETIYYFKNIKKVEFKTIKNGFFENLASLFIWSILIWSPFLIGIFISVYFFQNIYTISIASLTTLIIIGYLTPKKTEYKIFIDSKLTAAFSTENKEEFFKFKNKILENKKDS